MNVRLITKALHTLSLLSDEDYDLVLKLRALTEDEREQFRTALELQKPATKKAGKKPSKKSERASGMEAQLKERRGQRDEGRTRTNDDEGSVTCCFATVNRDGDGGEVTCGKSENDPVHDLTYLSSHSFLRDSRSALAAQRQSPANGGAAGSTASLEAEKGNVSTATGG